MLDIFLLNYKIRTGEWETTTFYHAARDQDVGDRLKYGSR